MRTLIWFSCGVTSAVAAKLALVEYPHAITVRIRIASEHDDSDRFANDVAEWLGREIITLTPAPRDNHFDVIEHHRYFNGPTGAKCTRELKQRVRQRFQQPTDLHVFGFDADETDRVADFRERQTDLAFIAPLVDAGLTKADCKAVIAKANIELPAMYRLGYANNNCVGCVKGGIGYWNQIRKDFPAVFNRMAVAERTIGATVLKHRSGPLIGKRMYLDELDPAAGRPHEDQPRDCGLFCDHALESVGL